MSIVERKSKLKQKRNPKIVDKYGYDNWLAAVRESGSVSETEDAPTQQVIAISESGNLVGLFMLPLNIGTVILEAESEYSDKEEWLASLGDEFSVDQDEDGTTIASDKDGKIVGAFIDGGDRKVGVNVREALGNETDLPKNLRSELASAAQLVYDSWDQTDEELGDPKIGFGGICQEIADEICNVLSEHDIECHSNGGDDQHATVIARLDGRVVQIDIPPHYYESGSGYNWKKKEGVTFTPDMVVVTDFGKDADWDLYQSESYRSEFTVNIDSDADFKRFEKGKVTHYQGNKVAVVDVNVIPAHTTGSGWMIPKKNLVTLSILDESVGDKWAVVNPKDTSEIYGYVIKFRKNVGDVIRPQWRMWYASNEDKNINSDVRNDVAFAIARGRRYKMVQESVFSDTENVTDGPTDTLTAVLNHLRISKAEWESINPHRRDMLFNKAWKEIKRANKKLKKHESTNDLADKIAKLKAMSDTERDNLDVYDFGYDAYLVWEAQKMMPKREGTMRTVNVDNSYALWQEADAVVNVNGHPYLATKQEDPDDEDDVGLYVWTFFSPEDYLEDGFQTAFSDKAEAIAEFKRHLSLGESLSDDHEWLISNGWVRKAMHTWQHPNAGSYYLKRAEYPGRPWNICSKETSMCYTGRLDGSLSEAIIPDQDTIGSFRELSHGRTFFYGRTRNPWALEHNLPHEIESQHGNKFARILNTVAYVAVDEDAEGKPVLEKWFIRHYSKRELSNDETSVSESTIMKHYEPKNLTVFDSAVQKIADKLDMSPDAVYYNLTLDPEHYVDGDPGADMEDREFAFGIDGSVSYSSNRDRIREVYGFTDEEMDEIVASEQWFQDMMVD